MRLRNLATAIGALGLVAAPVFAQAADAPAARQSTPIGEAEEIGGDSSGIIVAVLALAAIVGGIIIATDDGDEPTSP